jgi:hypothetical protein
MLRITKLNKKDISIDYILMRLTNAVFKKRKKTSKKILHIANENYLKSSLKLTLNVIVLNFA